MGCMLNFILNIFVSRILSLNRSSSKADLLYKLHSHMSFPATSQSSQAMLFPFSAKGLFSSYTSKDVNWHARLCHPSDHVLLSIAKKVDLGSSVVNTSPKCVVCTIAKAHKLPTVSSGHKSIKCLDLVFADLWTRPIVSLTGAKYFWLMIFPNICGFIFLPLRIRPRLHWNCIGK